MLLTVTTNVLLELADLGERGVLAASAEQVTQAVEGNTAVTALVEQGERLLVVGRSLTVELVRCMIPELRCRKEMSFQECGYVMNRGRLSVSKSAGLRSC